MHKRGIVQLLTFVLASLAAPAGMAQQGTYPSKPVMVIIPIAPGSVSETEGRIHMTKLSENLRQQFVIDFKAGAGGMIGSAYVAKAPPDGYTLMLVSASYSLIALRPGDLPFDRLNAFAPVSLLSKRWGMMMVHPSMPSTAAEFVAYVKANPDKVNYGSSGQGSQQHLTGAWMSVINNMRMTYVHYKGAGPIVPDLLAGRVHLTPMTLTSALPYIKQGKLKSIGLANLERSPAFPDIPTLAEQGWKDFEYSSWLGVVAPAKTPAAVVNLLSAELARGVKSPDIIKRLSDETHLVGSTPEQFGRHVGIETERWRKLMKETGIVLEE